MTISAPAGAPRWAWLAAAVCLALVVPTLVEAWQVNQAFLVVNHQPALLAGGGNPDSLAYVERQLTRVVDRGSGSASVRRMLAVARRSLGADWAGGVSLPELVRWGRQRQQAGDHAAAAFLFAWAAERAPAVADYWYYLGTAYQGQAHWEAALTAYQRAVEAGEWLQLGPGDAFLAQGIVYQTAWPETQLEAARASWQRALADGGFSGPLAEAQAHYRLAEVILWHDRNPAGALPHYEAALALDPADHWARLRLGYTIYWGKGDVAAAERTILAAIAQWPGDSHLKWPYFYLGEIYADAGLWPQAAAAYVQVLSLDPEDGRVRQRLAEVNGQLP